MEHTATYERYREKLAQLLKIRARNGLETNGILEYCEHLDKFQVVVPLIGEFSTGKSSLINALLDRKLLGVELTPETAVPTEICYGEQEKAIVYGKLGEETITIDKFSKREFSVVNVHKVQLWVKHEFLKEISTVKIVDMPGFNSGVELHNRAIDEYLPDANGYLITLSARTPTIPEDMANFLKELKLHDMPVYLLITKAKAVSEEELSECKKRIREDAIKYLGMKDVPLGVTNARGKEKIITPLRDFLRQVEADSQNIFALDAKNHLAQFGTDLATYLSTSIKQANLNPSEIEAEMDAAEMRLTQLKGKLVEAENSFDVQIEDCIAGIRGKLTSALTDAAPTLENMMVRNVSIDNKVNMIVRETVISVMQEDFAPRMKRYMEKVSEMIRVDLAFNTNISLDEEQRKADVMLKESTKAAITKAIPALLAAIGITLSGGLAAVVLTISGILVEIGFMKKRENEQRELAREKIHGELIPQVVNKTMETVRGIIQREVQEMNRRISDESVKQVAMQEKALSELKEQFASEQSKRQERLSAMERDLEDVQRLIRDED